MATTEQKKRWNDKWRDKQKKIKQFSKQLDGTVAEMERLAPCPACAEASARIAPYVVACHHTHERKRLHKEAELVRAQLQQIDH